MGTQLPKTGEANRDPKLASSSSLRSFEFLSVTLVFCLATGNGVAILISRSLRWYPGEGWLFAVFLSTLVVCWLRIFWMRQKLHRALKFDSAVYSENPGVLAAFQILMGMVTTSLTLMYLAAFIATEVLKHALKLSRH